jgi:hypothetical protein
MAYTTIDDPSAYFQVDLYTGTGSSLANTFDGNSDMQPDFVWIKERSGVADHALYDSSRGVEKQLESNTTTAETTEATGLTAFGSDGFTVGALAQVNTSSDTYVAWGWKANGGTTSSNTEGNVTNTLQVNQDAGFSISKFTSIISGNTTIGHGLGVTPDVFIVKIASGAGGWWMNHKGLTNQSDRYVGLHSLQAETTLSWGAAPTSTLITAAPGFIGNGTTTVMCYAFAEKQGYSKFGKYTGAGSGSPFVYTGFKPALVICKRTDSTNDWGIVDSKRETYNGATKTLFADLTNAESSTYTVDLLSNGFKPSSNHSIFNQSGGSYIYMAFAENPFTTSTGVPTTAR